MKIKKRTKLTCRSKRKSNRRISPKFKGDFGHRRENVMKRLIEESLRYEQIIAKMNNDPRFGLADVVYDEKVHGSLFSPINMLDKEKA